MGTFILILVGGFVCKFVYDSFLTDNTDRKFEDFSKSNPEAAARILNNNGGLLGSTQNRNKSVYAESMRYIANNNDWHINEVEDQLTLQLEEIIVTKDDYFSFMKRLQQEKGREAVQRKIDPEDTTAAISYNLAKKLYSPIYEGNQQDANQRLVDFLLKEYSTIIASVAKNNPMKGTPMEGMAYEVGIQNTTEHLLETKSIISHKFGVTPSVFKSTVHKVEDTVRTKLFK